jgi:Terminase large subunit, T4likevirus-type, N-terminal
MEPDPWQTSLLCSRAPEILICCSWQVGKSTAAAALALRTALVEPPSLVLVFSPTQRQSGEIFRKVIDLFNALGRPVPVAQESVLRIELANGSRIISLPGSPQTVRGFSAPRLVILDEAAYTRDELYLAIRPMLATGRGRLVALSTPAGARGWFYAEWIGPGPWRRIRVRAEECPRLTSDFLAGERRAMGPRWYRQEYQCSFESAVDSVFNEEDLQAAIDDTAAPLFVS